VAAVVVAVSPSHSSVTKVCLSSRKANGQLLTTTAIRHFAGLQKTAALLLTSLTVGCCDLNLTCRYSYHAVMADCDYHIYADMSSSIVIAYCIY